MFIERKAQGYAYRDILNTNTHDFILKVHVHTSSYETIFICQEANVCTYYIFVGRFLVATYMYVLGAGKKYRTMQVFGSPMGARARRELLQKKAQSQNLHCPVRFACPSSGQL
jgi:hypothetical protein